MDTVAHLTETTVFLFLGIGFFTFNHPYKEMGIGTILVTLFNLNIARFLNIFTVSKIVNKYRSNKNKFNAKQ